MQNTASVIRCLAVPRLGFRLQSFLRDLKAAVPAAALAAALLPGPVAGQVVVHDLQPVSMQFRASAQDGIRAHQAQIRARQVRVRQANGPGALPRFANNLTMSSDQGSAPLRLRDEPLAPKVPGAPRTPALKNVAPNTIGVINSFIRGDLNSESDNGTASGLATTDLTFGSDYRVSESLMFGVAAGSLHTRDATGTTVSAYVTLQPVERFFLDMSLSYGAHQARHAESSAADGKASAHTEGTSRSFSMTLNNPRQIGEWYWSPYSRYEHIVTVVQPGAAVTPPLSYGLSAMSVGSTAATTWATPFGAVRPMVMVEVQKEVITVAGLGTTSSMTQGIVGFGMTTKVSRDVSAFAESRYESDLAASLERQMMMGVKFVF
jgi:hypothetical protein